MADTGQVSTQAPQSMHWSGSMKFISELSSEWMQSAGQTSTQVASLVPMQGWVMTYAIAATPRSRFERRAASTMFNEQQTPVHRLAAGWQRRQVGGGVHRGAVQPRLQVE